MTNKDYINEKVDEIIKLFSLDKEDIETDFYSICEDMTEICDYYYKLFYSIIDILHYEVHTCYIDNAFNEVIREHIMARYSK